MSSYLESPFFAMWLSMLTRLMTKAICWLFKCKKKVLFSKKQNLFCCKFIWVSTKVLAAKRTANARAIHGLSRRHPQQNFTQNFHKLCKKSNVHNILKTRWKNFVDKGIHLPIWIIHKMMYLWVSHFVGIWNFFPQYQCPLRPFQKRTFVGRWRGVGWGRGLTIS